MVSRGQALLSQTPTASAENTHSGPVKEQAVHTASRVRTKLSSLQVQHPPQKQIRCSLATNQKLLHENDNYRLLSHHFVNSLCLYQQIKNV